MPLSGAPHPGPCHRQNLTGIDPPPVFRVFRVFPVFLFSSGSQFSGGNVSFRVRTSPPKEFFLVSVPSWVEGPPLPHLLGGGVPNKGQLPFAPARCLVSPAGDRCSLTSICCSTGLTVSSHRLPFFLFFFLPFSCLFSSFYFQLGLIVVFSYIVSKYRAVA